MPSAAEQGEQDCVSSKKPDVTGETVKIKEEVRLLYRPELEVDPDHRAGCFAKVKGN